MQILHKEIIQYEPFTIYLNDNEKIELIHNMKKDHIITPIMKSGFIQFNAFLLGLAKPLREIITKLVKEGYQLKTLKELREE